jgi:hypothetical protein
LTTHRIIEAPNWSRDGRFLPVNTVSDLHELPVAGNGAHTHDFSFDGKLLIAATGEGAISAGRLTPPCQRSMAVTGYQPD